MPKFLSRDEIYRILQRELPADVYPDGAPSAYFSTADNASIAAVAASGYDNLAVIYKNYFPQTADERIGDWETTVLGKIYQNLTLAVRQDQVLSALRTRRDISLWGILTLVASLIPAGVYVQIVEWGCASGGWILDVSELDLSTILNGANLVDATGPTLCEADPATFGKTPAEWAEMQREAYTYEIRIFNYTLTTDELNNLNTALDKSEPARSTRVLFQNLNPADYFLLVPVTNVDRFSGVNCITVDPSSSTGYSGLT